MAFNKQEYDINYVRENQKQVMVKINRKTEPDLYAWITGIEHPQTYIKSLILTDMKKAKTDNR